MIDCPGCRTQLVRQMRPEGIVYLCPTCKGLAAAMPVVRRAGAADNFVRAVWGATMDPAAPQIRPCPHCGRKMTQTTVAADHGPLTLDVCKACAVIWFDRREYAEVPHKEVTAPVEATLSPEAAQALAKFKAQEIQRRADESTPTFSVQWLPALAGLPVEFNDSKLKSLPWVTWTIAVMCIFATWAAVLGFGGMSGEEIVDGWGFVPSQWSRHGGLTLVTSFFLHGGWMHLIGNMYFLLVFGDNVEDRLHPLKYVLLLFAGHCAGAFLHGMLDPRPNVPLVGASAGISGVLGYYAIAFPHAKIGMMLGYRLLFKQIRMSVGWALGLYIAMQIIGAILEWSGFSSVSAFGHLGGVIVGIGAAVAARYMATPRTVAPRPMESRI